MRASRNSLLSQPRSTEPALPRKAAVWASWHLTSLLDGNAIDFTARPFPPNGSLRLGLDYRIYLVCPKSQMGHTSLIPAPLFLCVAQGLFWSGSVNARCWSAQVTSRILLQVPVSDGASLPSFIYIHVCVHGKCGYRDLVWPSVAILSSYEILF